MTFRVALYSPNTAVEIVTTEDVVRSLQHQEWVDQLLQMGVRAYMKEGSQVFVKLVVQDSLQDQAVGRGAYAEVGQVFAIHGCTIGAACVDDVGQELYSS